MFRSLAVFRVILLLAASGAASRESCAQAQEVIYDNTFTFLERFATEGREYGDQLELDGAARTLTTISFEYFGEFTAEGDETMRVRIYSNETPYDRFRNAPTTILYESGRMPMNAGFNSRTISGLNIVLPPDTATFTIEFGGLEEGEKAGLLLYSPPRIGFSFNEFWRRTANGGWQPFQYSATDPTYKANAALRLTATSRLMLDQSQGLAGAWVSMRDLNKSIRLAQTWTAATSGQLERMTVRMYWNDIIPQEPTRFRILNVVDGRPGTNVLGTAVLPELTGQPQSVLFTNEAVYLHAGQQYALECSTEAPAGFLPAYSLRASAGSTYPGGRLWFQEDAGGPSAWKASTLYDDGATEMDAVFEAHMLPGIPRVRITSPRPGQSFGAGQPVPFRAEVAVPAGRTATRVRFYSGLQEVGSTTNAPFEFSWSQAQAGEHPLTAVVEDSTRAAFRSSTVRVLVTGGSGPANDRFEGRITLEGNPPRTAGSSAGATLEAGEPRVDAAYSGATLWWKWTAPDGAPVIINARTANVPAPALGILTGETLAMLQPAAQGIGYLLLQPAADQEYAIVVDPKTAGDAVSLEIVPAGLQVLRAAETGAVTLRFVTASGLPATVQYSHDLKAWQNAGAAIPGTGQLEAWVDPGPPATEPATAQQPLRFYRLQHGP